MAERQIHPLPIRIEEIDKAWLTAALRSHAPDVVVNDARIVDVNNGTCTKIRIELALNAAGKRAGITERVILKGGFESHSRAMSPLHLSEVQGYRDVLPVLGLPSPACFFAEYDEELQQGIVIMEDLCLREVEFCSALRPQNFEQVARRLSDFASFHAKTWDSAELQPGGRWSYLPHGQMWMRNYMDQYLLNPKEWRRFIDSPRGAAASVRFHDLDTIIAAFDELVRQSREMPRCVVRGDTHLGNLYISADGSPGFFDALPGIAPAMLEIAYHIACALDTADRARWEGPLVLHYLSELRRNGVEPPSFDEAMRQYGLFLLNGYIIFIVNESFYQPEAINTAYTARFSAAMIDHRTLDLLKTKPG